MKLTEDFILLRDRETGEYLSELKNKQGTLATRAVFTKKIQAALTVPYESYLEQKKKFKFLASIHDCEIVRVQADYTLTYPNGADAPEITPTCPKGPEIVDILASIMKRG